MELYEYELSACGGLLIDVLCALRPPGKANKAGGREEKRENGEASVLDKSALRVYLESRARQQRL
jgi:hypothetical protein